MTTNKNEDNAKKRRVLSRGDGGMVRQNYVWESVADIGRRDVTHQNIYPIVSLSFSLNNTVCFSEISWTLLDFKVSIENRLSEHSTSLLALLPWKGEKINKGNPSKNIIYIIVQKCEEVPKEHENVKNIL